jgi:hypothetical protein
MAQSLEEGCSQEARAVQVHGKTVDRKLRQGLDRMSRSRGTNATVLQFKFCLFHLTLFLYASSVNGGGKNGHKDFNPVKFL